VPITSLGLDKKVLFTSLLSVADWWTILYNTNADARSVSGS